MRNDVTADRLLRVSHCHAVALGYDLVRDDDGDTELIRYPLQRAEEFTQVHLPSGQLASSGIVCTIKAGGRVNNQEGKTILGHQSRSL